MSPPRLWAYECARAFCIDEQKLTSTPDGIAIEPVLRGGFLAWGGGYRIQFGSGIAGRADAAAIVRVGMGDGPDILGPYVTTRRGLIAQLKKCRAVVCKTCKGWKRGDGTTGCKTCFGYGTYLDDESRDQAQAAYDEIKARAARPWGAP